MLCEWSGDGAGQAVDGKYEDYVMVLVVIVDEVRLMFSNP